MPFDPSQPFTIESEPETTGFDPNKPFTVESEPESKLGPSELVARARLAQTKNLTPESVAESFTPGPAARTIAKATVDATLLGQAAKRIPALQETAKKVEDLNASMMTPGGAAMIAGGFVQPELVAGLGAAMSAPAVKEGYKEAKTGIETGDISKTLGGATEMGLGVAGVGLGAMGIARLLPRSAAELAKLPEAELVREPLALPAPGESTATFATLPTSPLAVPKAGHRITLPAEPETAKVARQVWSKPIDIEAQVEGADALRQLASLTEEVKTPGQPYEPPSVNVDLRQLERMMQRNTVSKVESWADQVIGDKLRETGANPFLDPEFMAAAATKGAILFKRGVTTFAEWSSAMREQFGRGMDAQLPAIFEQNKKYWEGKTPTGVPKESPAVETAKSVTELPKVKSSTGATKEAPSGSAFAPNTPPDSDYLSISATKLLTPLRDWWEKVWPRSLAASRVAPDTPVITAHQRLLFRQMQYMEDFSKQDWWAALRNHDNNELIAIEDTMVKDFQSRIDAGEPVADAYNKAVATAPEDVQKLVRYRDSRIPIEAKAAQNLEVTPPQYRGEPYIARLTNEDGKAVVDLHPNVGNWGRMIQQTLGSFDQSRTHLTMKDGIEKGTQYDPVARAVWQREITSIRLEATADMLRELKENGTLYDTPAQARAASPTKEAWQVRGFGGKDYWARTRQEARFLEQNLNSSSGGNPLRKLVNLSNVYLRNPSLVNPLPHVTKNMLFKYIMARVNSATLKADTVEFQNATAPELKARFEKVMPMNDSGLRLPQMTAREVGTLPEKIMNRGLMVNNPSTQFIFGKADPAMRYSLWKSYVRKGMSDQEAANHVWMDLVRYDENSGGINFWKSIPMNFFVPWRTGTYTTLYKAFTSHPLRTLLFVGAVEYLREMRYRKTGRWTHLPVDYIDAPLAESIESPSKAPAIAATTLLFGPGGGQAPSSIKDLMSSLHNDPGTKARVVNMFWGLSQIYNMPREWIAYQKDGNESHLVNLLTSAALAEHSALKYEPRRLMKWLPEWMPGLEKSSLVHQAETLRARRDKKLDKSQATFERRHGVSATFEQAPEDQQMQELRRSAR